MDGDDDRNVIADGDVIRLVINVDRVAAQPARKHELLLHCAQVSLPGYERLDAIAQAKTNRLPRNNGTTCGGWLVPPAKTVKRPQINVTGVRQRVAEMKDVVADARERREQRRCV